MVCLGFEPGNAGWRAQMNPMSYGKVSFMNSVLKFATAKLIGPCCFDVNILSILMSFSAQKDR